MCSQDESDGDQTFVFANDRWRNTRISSDLQFRSSECMCNRKYHPLCWTNRWVSGIVFQVDGRWSRQVPSVLERVTATTIVSNNIVTNISAVRTEQGQSIMMSTNLWSVLPLMHRRQGFIWRRRMKPCEQRTWHSLLKGALCWIARVTAVQN